MSRVYSDYISLSNEFVPVFDKNADIKYPNHWKSFYPHQTFIDILNDLVGTLEGTSAEKAKSIWVSGAYGTGKSFASYTLKHIIEDNDDDVSEYFRKYEISQTLLNRLNGIKQQGKILIVTRSSSSGIVGDNMLFAAIQDSVKNELHKKKYRCGGATLYENIIEKLNDEDSSFNFNGAFTKHKNKFMEYPSSQSVIDALEKLGPAGSLDLIEKIIQVADYEGFNFTKTADDVIAWIKEIKQINGIKTILFIWDEFTEFFQKNTNSLTGFQELLQASEGSSFYFLIITHKAHSQFIFDNDRRKILEARFKTQKIEMANTTAFMLMKQAVNIVPDLQEEWITNRQNLWIGVEKSVKSTLNQYVEDIDNNDLQALLPLHPYAAFLLQRISAEISSNQRTMFQFICGDPQASGDLKKNFKWFIANNKYDTGSWCYQTSDYIWDYFFSTNNNNNTMDLDDRARNACIHYENFESQCANEDQRRILKVALILTAIQQGKGRGASNLLRPTLSNISAAFSGTKLEDSVRSIMEWFTQKGIFGTLPEGTDVLYVTQSQNIDPEAYAKIESQVRYDDSFEKMIANSEYDCIGNFQYNGYAKLRFVPLAATHRNIKNRMNEVRKISPNQVPIIYVFAKNQEDVVLNVSAIDAILREAERDVVIVDLSSQPFSDTEYENYIKCKVKANYFVKVNMSEANLNMSTAKSIIDEFKKKINVTTIKILSNVSTPVSISGIGQFSSQLNDVDSMLFTCGIESLTQNDSFFSAKGYTKTTVKMGMGIEQITASAAYLNHFKQDMSAQNIWETKEYYTKIPAHVLSQMKNAIEKLIETSFNQTSSVAVDSIWKCLQDKPFGLLECTGSAFIIGFLMKEYPNAGYYLKDENRNSQPLNDERLADILIGVIKGLKGSENRYIVKMTEEHRRFCECTGKIFKISQENQNSIQDILISMKTKLLDVDFPLWALKPYINKNDPQSVGDQLLPIIDLYCELISPGKEPGRDETKIAEEIASIFQKDAVFCESLAQIFNSQNLKTGMGIYVEENKPEIIAIAEKLNVDNNGYISEVKRRFKQTKDAVWLWNMEDFNGIIDDVYLDYCLINQINFILFSPVNNFVKAAYSIKTRLSSIKIPLEFIKKEGAKFADLMAALIPVYQTESFDKIDKRKLSSLIGDQAIEFVEFFSNQQSYIKQHISGWINEKVTNEEAEYIFGELLSDAILSESDVYEEGLRLKLKKYRKEKKYNLLLELWKNITKTTSPMEWSKTHKLPILCLFENEIADASEIFDLINQGDSPADENKTEKAILFLETNNKCKKLSDTEFCNNIFKDYAAGDYALLINNIDDMKNVLFGAIEGPVYDWIIKKTAVNKVIKEYAEEKYLKTYYLEVEKKIEEFKPDEVVLYFKELIRKEPLIGMQIMKDN